MNPRSLSLLGERHADPMEEIESTLGEMDSRLKEAGHLTEVKTIEKTSSGF